MAEEKRGGGSILGAFRLTFSGVLWFSSRLQTLPLWVRYCRYQRKGLQDRQPVVTLTSNVNSFLGTQIIGCSI